jgi:hypothetical protein
VVRVGAGGQGEGSTKEEAGYMFTEAERGGVCSVFGRGEEGRGRVESQMSSLSHVCDLRVWVGRR